MVEASAVWNVFNQLKAMMFEFSAALGENAPNPFVKG